MFQELKKAKLTSSVPVLSIVKNEIFFLPAFLDHYRRLGAKQFVFLDDRSDDGTSEYLMAQDDCTVVASDLSFGQYVDGKKAHFLWRTALPQKYCDGGWGLLVDADEFLELPPGFDDLETFTRFLDRRGATAVGGVMVDFYPAKALDLRESHAPQNMAELLARYPYFDDCHYGSWMDGRNEFRGTYGGVRQRLMDEHQIALYGPAAPRRLRSRLRELLGLGKQKRFCALYKVPFIRWDENCCHTSPHKANRAPDAGIQLPLMHFKFTGSLLQKIDFAIESEGYDRQSADYRAYRDLLATMMQRDASLLGSNSRRYSNKQDFIPSRILRFDAARGEILDDRRSAAKPTQQWETRGDRVA